MTISVWHLIVQVIVLTEKLEYFLYQFHMICMSMWLSQSLVNRILEPKNHSKTEPREKDATCSEKQEEVTILLSIVMKNYETDFIPVPQPEEGSFELEYPFQLQPLSRYYVT